MIRTQKSLNLPVTIKPTLVCLLWLISWAIPFAAYGEQASLKGYHHRFQNAEQWAKIFDDPDRDQWQQPEKVIAQFKIQPNTKDSVKNNFQKS